MERAASSGKLLIKGQNIYRVVVDIQEDAV